MSSRQNYLECHQETLAFDIGETQVDATRVAIGVTIPDYVLNTRVDPVDESVG